MTTYAVYAAHAFSNSLEPPQEYTRTGSKETAERIAAKLKSERFTSGGKRLKRYSAIFVQEMNQ